MPGMLRRCLQNASPIDKAAMLVSLLAIMMGVPLLLMYAYLFSIR
ncbi:hypothetical protein EV147_0444 [Cupriavidus agavae]|uniref:Uncharacterized protein n=1 Tax=Cupriavidus agavae TaxID=1001822 RepID=A0A4Q7S568_9BURK|nr:hypothetical protein EV147_0444 [Cupriavidus agavae]